MTEELSFIRDSLTQMLENDKQDNELIKVGQNFHSITDIRQAAIRYARRHKFAVSTLRSGARQLVLVCKHSGAYRATKPKSGESSDVSPNNPEQVVSSELQSPTPSQESTVADQSAAAAKKGTRKKLSQKIQCPFEIRAKPMGSSWIIYKVNYEHNHEMATDIKAYAQHRKLSPDTRELIISLMNSGSTNTTILEYLQLKGIDNVLKKDIANIRQAHFNCKPKKDEPPQCLSAKVPEDESLQYPKEASQAPQPAEKSSPTTDNIEQMPSTASSVTTTNQSQSAEGEQLYRFISQNNVQVN